MMYSYYAFRAMRWYIPKWIQMTLTTLQLTQMVIGVYITYKAYKYKQEGVYCYVSHSSLRWSFILAIAYFCLFLHFFLVNYMQKKSSCVSGSLLKIPISEHGNSTSTRVKGDMNDEPKKRI
jgi:hypothetical protein